MASRQFPPKKFLDVLKILEDKLVSALRVNALELCDRFFELCLLSSESHAHFTSLDHSRLSPQLLVRYLLRVASEKIKKNLALVPNFTEVLGKGGVPSSVTEELIRAVAVDRGPAEDSGVVGSSLDITAGGTVRPETVFTEDDQGKLTEWLLTISHKWESLALSLRIPNHDISIVVESDMKCCLYKCIGLWLTNDCNPTWKKLKAALCSKVVGEISLAKSLEEKIKIVNEVATLDPNEKPFFPRIIGQSLPIEATDGKSTLLQFLARPKEYVASCQWSKDGQPLVNSSRYAGVDDDILVVKHASQGTERKYTCCVHFLDIQVTSNIIELTVNFSQAKNLLLKKYSILKEVQTSERDWPPVTAKVFINLALVKDSGDLNKKMEFSFHGNADDFAEKEMIEYEDIFNEYRSSELILMEGRPGSGKTTLVHKIVKDWVVGKVLVKARLTFLISLLHSQADTLSSFFQHFFMNEEDLKLAVANMVSSAGEGVCFILDDFDKCRLSEEGSVVQKLVNKEYLPKAMIILSSRPNATLFLSESLISKRIEVIGFSKKQIIEYIDNFPFCEDGGRGASEVKAYLWFHPNIHDMCYLPVHAAMVCFLFRFSDSITSTQTKMYEEFTRLTIHRHLARKKTCRTLFLLKDLVGENKECFKDLCRLAYEMTIKSKRVVSSQELQILLGGSNSLNKEGGLGLLTIGTTLYQTGIDQSYTFLHSTFQEFLTAYYIANYMDKNQWEDILQKCRGMKSVWLFFSGMVRFEEPVCVVLDELLKSSSDMELFQYAFESGQKVFCDRIVKRNAGRFFFPQLSPSDMMCIGFALEKSSEPVTELVFAGHAYKQNQIVPLLLHVEKAEIYSLNLLEIGFLISDSGTDVLCKVLQHAKSIVSLVLNIEHYYPFFASSLVETINDCTKLARLNISYVGTSECIKSFVSSLKSCLECLRLVFKGLDEHSIQALGEGFVNLRAERLDLKISKSWFDKTCLSCLVGNLQRVQSLYLDLSRNNIDGNAITRMARECEKTDLRRLSLSFNSIGSAGGIALAEGLKFLSRLEELKVSHSDIGSAGASAIAKELKCVPKLKKLELSHNAIESSGVIELVDNLYLVPNLEYINLEHNNIEHSKTEIETSLKKFKALKVDLDC